MAYNDINRRTIKPYSNKEIAELYYVHGFGFEELHDICEIGAFSHWLNILNIYKSAY